jgi:hypothetical protein
MRNPNKYSELPFTQLVAGVGLNLPSLINNLNDTLTASKENYNVLKAIMDPKTELTERVKLLELELFIAVLKKL